MTNPPLESLPMHPLDTQWSHLAEAESMGEPLTAEQIAFLQQHQPLDPVLRAEQRMRHQLALWEQSSLQDLSHSPSDDALIASVVDTFVAERDTAAVRQRGKAGTQLAWGIGSLLAVAAAAALVWTMPGDKGLGLNSGANDGVAQVDQDLTPSVTPPTPRTTQPQAIDTRLAVLSGTWLDEKGNPLGDTLPDDAELTVLGGRACLGRDKNLSVCVEPGSRVRTRRMQGRTVVEVVEGDGEVELAPEFHTSSFEVHVAGFRVEAQGAQFTVETTKDGHWDIAVQKGNIAIEAEDKAHNLKAGQSMTLQDEQLAAIEIDAGADTDTGGRSSRKRGPDAPSLLAQARAARSAGKTGQAIRLYEQLIARHPRSALAQTALVTLGQLYLSQGKATSALKAYDRYLKRGGPLAEEAMYGRITALGKLGRSSQEKAAIERFLKVYPSSSYAPKLRRRLSP